MFFQSSAMNVAVITTEFLAGIITGFDERQRPELGSTFYSSTLFYTIYFIFSYFSSNISVWLMGLKR